MNILSVENIMITIGDYPLSWIEFTGTVLYFASVWLIARKNLLTWPVSLVSVTLYGILFWQIRLYSDMLEQLYYLGIGVWGWISWTRIKDEKQSIPSGFSPPKVMAVWALGIAAAGMLLGLAVARFHIWLPSAFPAPADYPFLDAFTTVASFAAMYLMTRRRTESWLWWIAIDAIGIGLYWVKDVRFIAIQYIALFFMALWGLGRWIAMDRASAQAARSGTL
jgi:nicotinamide mononucleotide transporter